MNKGATKRQSQRNADVVSTGRIHVVIGRPRVGRVYDVAEEYPVVDVGSWGTDCW